MNELTEFQRRAASVATVKMLGGTSFSICDLDAIAKTVGRESALAGRDYSALRSVHCVAWADMGPDLSRLGPREVSRNARPAAADHRSADARATARACARTSEAPAPRVLEIVMACPKCGCKVHYQVVHGFFGDEELDDDRAQRCAACNAVFDLDDAADDGDDEEESSAGIAGVREDGNAG